jgi:GT2 family glycosyltransferase
MAEPSVDPLTSVIIVTYNSAEDIVDCLASFRGAMRIEVVVIDNDSVDTTAEILARLKREGAIDVLLQSPENQGFARAVNTGIAAAHGRDVLLLNPDARISAGDLEALRSTIEEDSHLGIVAPVVTGGPGVAVMSAGREPTLWPLLMHFSGIARAFPRIRWMRGRHLYVKHHSHEDHDVEWASGGCLYISHRTLDRIGGLSERWFMYGEDIDYCHRARAAGLGVRVIAGISAQHAMGASVAKSSSANISTLWARSSYDYYCVTYAPGPVRRFAWRMIFSTGLYARSALSALMALSRSSNRSALLDRASRFRRFASSVWTFSTPE